MGCKKVMSNKSNRNKKSKNFNQPLTPTDSNTPKTTKIVPKIKSKMDIEPEIKEGKIALKRILNNERMTNSLTSCIGAETHVSVVNGSEYRGSFQVFNVDGKMGIACCHKSLDSFPERKQNLTKIDPKNSPKFENKENINPNFNEPKIYPKPNEITDKLLFHPEHYV